MELKKNNDQSSQEPDLISEYDESSFEKEGSKEFREYYEEKYKTIKPCEVSTKERNEEEETKVNQNPI